MLLDLLLASAHHLAVFALFAALAGEWLLLLRSGLDAAALRQLARLDQAYGLLALLTLGAGALRVAYGLKGSAYYLGQPLFWTKLGLFALIGLLSALPTLRILRWQRQLKAGGSLPAAAELQATRSLVAAQLLAFLLLPPLAAALARGFFAA